jgi:fluoride exporter
MIYKLLFIAIGGIFGVVLRFLITQGINQWFKSEFLWGTVIVNLLGCFIIGAVIGYHKSSVMNLNLYLLLIVGFSGGLTTFASYAFEVMTYFSQGRFVYGISDIFIQTVLGLLFVFLGFRLTTSS